MTDLPSPSFARARLVAAFLLALALAAMLRGLWLTSDPPTHGAVGIVWHDEGAWVHNARNRVLWGVWRTDAWNPVFLAPVFTGLEYAAFRTFGVGLWQARLVPLASGLLAVTAVAVGLFALRGRRAALAGAFLLATNYPFVMWNRAALMESTMTMFIVGAWACYALASRRPRWGWLSGALASLAWFSKAAAAFFIVAITCDAAITLAVGSSAAVRRRLQLEEPTTSAMRGAATTLLGLALSASLIALVFVVPYWTEYRFYNWQMSVTRKPSYSVSAVLDRASWLPLVQGIFSKMWLTLGAAALSTGVIISRWRNAAPAERLLVLWLLAGLAELMAHDAGNERRYVMLIPALVALAASLVEPGPLTPRSEDHHWRWLVWPAAVLMSYLIVGTALRVVLLPEVVAGDLKLAVRVSTLLAVMLGTFLTWRWDRIEDVLSRYGRTRIALLPIALASCLDIGEYAAWARHRTSLNFQASRTVGHALPAGTLVHGKLANGLALENAIRPVFVGRGFGNYDDRLSRDDVRYVLTYVSPYVGYEGPVIRDVLRAYPSSSIVMTFPVAESGSDHDLAALVNKFGAPGEVPLASVARMATPSHDGATQ